MQEIGKIHPLSPAAPGGETKGAFSSSAKVFALGFVAFCALAAALVGAFPLAASIATVFLFAGVHNAFEFRYFLARMPARWGKSKAFYAAGVGGVVVLTGGYLALYFASGNWLWGEEAWAVFAASWNTAFVLWLGALVYLRGRQKPKTDWSLAFPAAFLAAAFLWLLPQYWSLALVYLHPLVALWFLERQIRRTKKEWLAAYHVCLATIPVFLLILWFALSGSPHLSEETNLFWRIAQHAGSGILPNVSSHLLVAAHVFLETIHYAAWIVLIPLVDRRAVPWRVGEIPLATARNGFRKLVLGLLAVSALLVFVLWAGFAVDYTTARDVYFAFAIAHVLAEFPFLIKML